MIQQNRAHRVRRNWARVRFNPEAKLRNEQALMRSRPMMLVRKGMFSPDELHILYPELR